VTRLYLDPHETTSQSANIPGLDGIRAISILMVMLNHSKLQVPGVLGVTIFFFLSGFLITSLLLDEYQRNGSIDISKFYLRRFLRLYPPLLAYLAVVVIALIALQGHIDLFGLTAIMFYFANYLYALMLEAGHIESYGIQLWSLSIEEQFYMVFPPLLLLLLNKRAAIVAVLAGMCLVPLAIRWVIVAETEPSFYLQYTTAATETRFDSILSGCVTAVAIRQSWGPRFIGIATRRTTACFALILLLVAVRVPSRAFLQTLQFTLQDLALISLLLTAVYTPNFLFAKRLMNHSVTLWIAALSYSLYLWHFALFRAAQYVLDSAPPVLSYGLGWIASFAIAYAVHVGVERPIVRLRKHFGSRAHEDIDEQVPLASAEVSANR